MLYVWLFRCGVSQYLPRTEAWNSRVNSKVYLGAAVHISYISQAYQLHPQVVVKCIVTEIDCRLFKLSTFLRETEPVQTAFKLTLFSPVKRVHEH